MTARKTSTLFAALAGVIVATLVAPPGAAVAEERPLVRFGVVADPQYAPVPPSRTRFFANSLWKLSVAVDAFNQQELDFVVTLGDVIDRHAQSFQHILPIYRELRAEHRVVLGNHDFSVHRDYLETVPTFLGLAERHYEFTVGGVRFIALDGNDLSLYANREGTDGYAASRAMYDALVAADAPNAQRPNGGLSLAQLAWLRARLDAARAEGLPVVVLSHFPAAPAGGSLNLWNADDVVMMLGEYDNVLAYLNGHDHAGNYAQVDGIHYVTFEGMVDTPAETAYGVVEIYPDRLVIEGEGRLTDRELPLDRGD